MTISDSTGKPTAVDAPPVIGPQFRALIETALDVMAVLNYDGTFRYLSPSVQRAVGYLPHELEGKRAFDFMHDEDALVLREVFQSVISDLDTDTVGDPRSFRFRHKYGHMVVIEAVSTKLPEGPEPPWIVVNARDITDRVQAQEDLRKAAEEAEVIAEIGRIISSTFDIDNVYGLFADQVKKLIHFDSLSIGIYDEETKRFRISYWSGFTVDTRRPGTVIDPTGTLTEAITTAKAPQIAQGMNKEELRNKYPYLINSYEAGMRSWLACPMFNRGEFIGP
ncbi:MAG: hypothetical protein CL759_01525 [Chloroflexi bacterium]|nr:hypothetical protein [Chloroflexota bacterium]